MTVDEARRDRQRTFRAEQTTTSKKLTATYGNQLLKKYGPAKYAAWLHATEEAGTR